MFIDMTTASSVASALPRDIYKECYEKILMEKFLPKVKMSRKAVHQAFGRQLRGDRKAQKVTVNVGTQTCDSSEDSLRIRHHKKSRNHVSNASDCSRSSNSSSGNKTPENQRKLSLYHTPSFTTDKKSSIASVVESTFFVLLAEFLFHPILEYPWGKDAMLMTGLVLTAAAIIVIHYIITVALPIVAVGTCCVCLASVALNRPLTNRILSR